MGDQAQLLDKDGRHIFQREFIPLAGFWGKANELYDQILRLVFNAQTIQRLTLTQLAKSDGELALSLGTNPPFGVINIGNASDFFFGQWGKIAR